MSFWGGDETIYVSSVIYQLGDELDKIPDVVKASVIGAGMKGTSRSYAIKKSIIDGSGIKLRQGFNYAAKSYYAGLPNGTPRVSSGSDDTVLIALVDEYLTSVYSPSSVEVVAAWVEYATDRETILRQQIESEYKYDFYEDRVHTSVYGIPVESTLVYEGLPADATLHPGEQGWRLTFTKPDTTTVSFDEWYADSLFATEGLVENRLFIQVRIDGNPATTTSYAYGGPSAALNLILRDVGVTKKTTFPAIVLKKKNKYLNTNEFHSSLPQAPDWWKTRPAYKTSKVYGKRMGVDIDKLLKVIKDNPDEGKIDYAFVQPGTIISSPNQAAIEYHYNYFNRLRLQFPDNKPAFDAWLAKANGMMTKSDAKNCPAQYVQIVDPDDTKGTVNFTISWRYMTYEEKSGTLPTKWVAECGAKNEKVTLFRIGRAAVKNVKYQFTPLYLRKRLTESTYAELCIVGLWHENYVFKGETVKSAVWDAFNDPDGDYGTGFLIPLDLDVLLTLSAREQLQLAQEAQHVVFNCYKVVKEKWYQTGIFKVVMIIIAIVVVVISWGTLSPYVSALYGGLYGGLVAAGVGLTLAAALAAVLTALIVVGVFVAVQLVAKEAGEWAAEQWGPIWGALVQIVVTIALTWGIGQLGSMYLGVAITPMTLTQQVVAGLSYVMSGLSTYTQFQMEQLVEEQKQWNNYVDSMEQPLEQLKKLWEENFPEMDLPAQMWFAPLEKPNDWLVRTQSTGDALVNRLIAPIEYMCDITLTPRLQ